MRPFRTLKQNFTQARIVSLSSPVRQPATCFTRQRIPTSVPAVPRPSKPASDHNRTLLSCLRSSQDIHRAWRGPLRDWRSVRYNSSGPSPNPTPHLGSPQPGLRDQLQRLFREYGWSAVGVYLALSVADLPICLLIVRMAGADRVGAAEHAVLEWIRKAWRSVNPMAHNQTVASTEPPVDDVKTATVREGVVGSDLAQAEAATQDGEASTYTQRSADSDLICGIDIVGLAAIWTQLALAYAIHKSLFIFIRIPLTVAITPKVVKTLRGWGWQIGRRPMRPSKPK